MKNDKIESRFDSIDEQYKKLMQAIIHIHSDVEACCSRIEEVERKLIMHSDKNIDQTTDDIIAQAESYSPINEEDANKYKERLKSIRGW